MKPFIAGPVILLIDNNQGRVEFCRHLFFQNGYLVRSASLDALEENSTLDDVKLVLSYLPFNKPEMVSERGIPVLFMIPDDSHREENLDSNNLLVAYASSSENSDTLFEKIGALIDA